MAKNTNTETFWKFKFQESLRNSVSLSAQGSGEQKSLCYRKSQRRKIKLGVDDKHWSPAAPSSHLYYVSPRIFLLKNY